MRSRAESAKWQAVVFDAIVAAAEAGRPCPTNPEICGLVEAESPATAARIVNTLERRGLIAVTRFNSGREITVPSLGIATAPYTGKRSPHWRTTGAARPVESAEAVARPDDEHLPPAVYREPCPRCGTRRDIGCKHHAVRLGMGAF
jgi:hypothetical protein